MAKLNKWSISAVNTLRQCNRKYYFASVLANFHHSNRLKRKAFELSNMQDFSMWAGKVVDKIIEKEVLPSIINNESIDFDQVVEKAFALAQMQFRFSKEGWYKDPDVSKTEAGDDFCILNVHEEFKPYTDQEFKDVFNKIKIAILNFPKITLPGSNKLLLDYIKESKNILPNITTWSFEIENCRVSPQIDLLMYNNYKPVIIDWKVSDSYSSDYSRQLIICGLTVYFTRLRKVETDGKKPYDFSDIKLYEVNLLKCEMKEHVFTVERANELIDYINLTGSDIALLTDELTGSIEDINGFEISEDEGVCLSCNYQSLCENLFLNNNQYDEESYTEFVQDKQYS